MYIAKHVIKNFFKKSAKIIKSIKTKKIIYLANKLNLKSSKGKKKEIGKYEKQNGPLRKN